MHVDSEGSAVSWSFRLAVKRSQTGRSGVAPLCPNVESLPELNRFSAGPRPVGQLQSVTILKLQPEDRCRHRSRAEA